jgi:hypothetical protein
MRFAGPEGIVAAGGVGAHAARSATKTNGEIPLLEKLKKFCIKSTGRSRLSALTNDDLVYKKPVDEAINFYAFTYF